MEIECVKCGNRKETELDLHHIIPRYLGGTDKDGRVYLCGQTTKNKCHWEIHRILNFYSSMSTKKDFIKTVFNHWVGSGGKNEM